MPSRGVIVDLGHQLKQDLQASVSRFASSVKPIIVFDDSKNLKVLGTATFLKISGRGYVFTARHVLEDSENNEIHISFEKQLVRLDKEKFIYLIGADLVFAIIDERFFTDLNEVYFIDEGEVYTFRPSRQSYSAIVGFPASKGKFNSRRIFCIQMVI